MKYTTVVQKLAAGNEGLTTQIFNSFSYLSLQEDFDKANAIFIKPNLTYPVYKKGVTTRVEFVENIVRALRQINSSTKIYIGEGEGGYNSFSMTKAMKNMGFFDIEKKYPNIQIINLSDIPSKKVELKANRKPYFVDLPALILDEIDFSITCPLPKVHCMTKITLAFKNQWGCLSDTMRLKNHYVFDQIIGQVCDKLKFRYVFLDGKYGLNINGPISGSPVNVDWFVASNSLGAHDVIVAEMMGVNWKKIDHLCIADQYGFIPKKEAIDVVGNVKSLKKNFILKGNLWNYPAKFAFHSKNLTYLFYFSRWAKLLHDIMYLFRKKQI